VKLGKHFLPNFPIPEGMTIDEYFRKVSFDGLEERLSVLLPKDTTEDYESQASGLRRPAEFRAGYHHPDGVPRLLPDRDGLYPVGQE
jgi:hypothetical protein